MRGKIWRRLAIELVIVGTAVIVGVLTHVWVGDDQPVDLLLGLGCYALMQISRLFWAVWREFYLPDFRPRGLTCFPCGSDTRKRFAQW
jgi:hypothetical protein